jgi:nicotinamide-nucleotide amidase
MTALVEAVARALIQRGEQLATAESCTGGLLAKQLTDRPGSSAYFERGVVTYSNVAKTELLGVPRELIARHGAVSGEVARAMANGLIERCPAHWAIAITGIAGPDGGSVDKPVGTVWIALARRGAAATARRWQLDGDREAVRDAAAAAALQGLLEQLAG